MNLLGEFTPTTISRGYEAVDDTDLGLRNIILNEVSCNHTPCHSLFQPPLSANMGGGGIEVGKALLDHRLGMS